MRYISYGICIVLALFLGACANILESLGLQDNKPKFGEEEIVEVPTKFKILQIRSPQISFYDFATLSLKKQSTEIELYKLGKRIGKIVIDKSNICFNTDCRGKWLTSRGFFGEVGYGDLFEDIILGRDIFNGEGKRINEKGAFVQHFIKSKQEIYYERTNDYTVFQNLTTGVLIGIQDYKVRSTTKK